MPGAQTELSIWTTPVRAAARVGATPPSARISCIEPIGAKTMGNFSFCPSSVVEVSICETSRSTRDRKA